MLRILVRGSGDVGSAVAHRLFTSGHAVSIHDAPLPTTTRRSMAFTDAIFDGHAWLEEVKAVRLDELEALAAVLAERRVIPVIVADFSELLRAVEPDVLVDARMRKRAQPERQLGAATLTIGL